MTTQVPSGLQLTIDHGRASVTGAKLNPPALAQVVYALTTFPTVQSVNGKTRADVEGFVPPILVEQPSPGEAVTSPLHVTGNANTFEATFNYDAEGRERQVAREGLRHGDLGLGHARDVRLHGSVLGRLGAGRCAAGVRAIG